MKAIDYNPFRIIGVPANSSLRELQSRKAKISAYVRVGKTIDSAFDFNLLENLERSSEDIEKAFSAIEQNQDKINHSLFWFVNANPIDDTAIQHMLNGNVDKAIEIWNKLTEDKEIGAKNFSAFNNLSTLYLLDESDFEQGISIKAELIESEYFIDFVHLVADETVRVDTNKQVEYFVDQIIRELKDEFNTNDLLDYFDSCTGYTQEYVSKRFTDEPIHTIESLIENTKRKRDENEYQAYAYGISLYTDSRESLTLLRSLLGSANLKYSILADKLANELLQCSVVYCNANVDDEKDDKFIENAIKLAGYAKSIALGKPTLTRINENLEIIESMRDRELNAAIELLKTIKKAYDEACEKIDKQVDDLQYEQLPGYGSHSFRRPNLNVSINWSEVNKMKRNALNWDKVVELIKESISNEVLNKIKKSNSNRVIEYKELLEFFIDKMNMSQVMEIKYLIYWKELSINVKSTGNTNTEPSWLLINIWWIIIVVGFVLGANFNNDSLGFTFVGIGIAIKLIAKYLK